MFNKQASGLRRRESDERCHEGGGNEWTRSVGCEQRSSGRSGHGLLVFVRGLNRHQGPATDAAGSSEALISLAF